MWIKAQFKELAKLKELASRQSCINVDISTVTKTPHKTIFVIIAPVVFY